MDSEDRQSPRPSLSSPDSAPMQRRSTDSEHPASERVESIAQKRASEDATPAIDATPHTPETDGSHLSHQLPVSSPPALIHQTESSSDARDLGVDAGAPIIRVARPSSDSTLSMPSLMPIDEDRSDLWRNGHDPPTFRPRTENVDSGVQTTAVVNNNTEERIYAIPRPRRRGVRRVFAFFGYGTGNRHRKELVSLIWTISFGSIQFAVTLSMIIYSSIHRSPKQPSISEWTACDKPLGLWSCFWIFKIILDCCMTYWGWRRDRKARENDQTARNGQTAGAHTDVEQGIPALPSGDPNMDIPAVGPVDRQRRRIENNSSHPRLYSRLSLLLSLTILSWFLTSNILVFNSLNSCRFAAPHLWWLVFGILCLQYLVIAQVFATAMIVFIIGPLIYLFWNLFLICLGRHPIQNPHFISPEVGKISKNVVNQIPLVLYIPSPPEDEKKGVTSAESADNTGKTQATSAAALITGAEHTYPPKPPASKRRFTFLSRKSSKSAATVDTGGPEESVTVGEKPAEVWEDCWESGEFPFVRLDENRASCAICLLDFEEPKRRVARDVIQSWALKNKEGEGERAAGESKGEDGGAADTAGAASSNGTSSQPSQPEVEEVSANDNILHLEDAGEGAQPLRLLPCGHAFHKTCIDPWLTDVSGRCPTCQRPVIEPEPPKNKRNR